MLWLGIDFPQLRLECLTRTQRDKDQAFVLVENSRVTLCSTQAKRCGIRSGISFSTARTIAKQPLCALRPQPQLEQSALSNLAECALSFTSIVSLHPPRGLLLELAGSLRLFLGLDNLISLIERRFIEEGFAFTTALAPTPAAACLLAEQGSKSWIDYCDPITGLIHRSRFYRHLGELPLSALTSDTGQLQKMHRAGLQNLADVLSLPATALGRRYGQDFISRLDKLCGRQPDPRPPFLPAEDFKSAIQFADGLTTFAMLRFPMHRLLGDLQQFLYRRQHWCEALLWLLHCSDHSLLKLRVRCSTPRHDTITLLELSELEFETLSLKAPVECIELHCTDHAPLAPQSQELFATPGTPDSTAPALLLDRLRARLGDQRLYGIHSQASHLPEETYLRYPMTTKPIDVGPANIVPDKPRPLWLLSRIQRLECDRDGPNFKGTMKLLDGPERIQCNWWTNKAQRDYFIAQHPEGALCWIFRDISDGCWYLHGFFA